MTAYHFTFGPLAARAGKKAPRAVVLCALVTSACGAGRPGGASSYELCADRLTDETPASGKALAPEAPPSRLAVDVVVDTLWLARELGRKIPVTLAQARRQPVGAPGEASYRVTRGGFGIKLDAERAIVSTPITVQIQVCKPFGPVCVEYGHCTPALAASVGVPLVLSPEYEIGAARAAIQVTRPCVILGNDVTPHIRDAARRELASLESRVNAELPKPRAQIAAAWKLLQVPIALGAGPCVRIVPERALQERPLLARERLSLRLGVTGRVMVEQPCAPADAPRNETALPAPELTEKITPGIALDVPVRIGWEDVSAELSRSLAGPLDIESGLRVLKVRAAGSSRAGRGAVKLDLTIEGPSCGDVALVAEPFYDKARLRIGLRAVELVPGQPRRTQALKDQGLEAAIAKRASIALPIDPGAAAPALEALVERLTSARPKEVHLEIKLEPARIERVLTDELALTPVVRLSGQAQVKLE